MRVAACALACLLVALCWQGDASSSGITVPWKKGEWMAWAWCLPACFRPDYRRITTTTSIGRPAINMLLLRSENMHDRRAFVRTPTTCMCEAGNDVPAPIGKGGRIGSGGNSMLSMEKKEKQRKRGLAKNDDGSSQGRGDSSTEDTDVDMRVQPSSGGGENSEGFEASQSKTNKGAASGFRKQQKGRRGRPDRMGPDPLEQYVNELLSKVPEDMNNILSGPESSTFVEDVLGSIDRAQDQDSSGSKKGRKGESNDGARRSGRFDAGTTLANIQRGSRSPSSSGFASPGIESTINIEEEEVEEEEEEDDADDEDTLLNMPRSLEAEMQKREGQFARQLFSLREEEARIILPPLQQELETLLLNLEADKAEAAVASRLQSLFGEEWKAVINTLRDEINMHGPNICNMLSRDRTLLSLRPERIIRMIRFLKTELGLDSKSLRYVFGRRPSLISQTVYGGDGEGVFKVCTALRELGISPRQLRVLVTTCPGVLCIPPNNVNRLTQALEGEGLDDKALCAIVRRAPWILLYDTKDEVQPVLECLSSIGVQDMRQVIAAYPQVLGLNPEEQILRICSILLEIGIEADSIARMIETCPAFLGVPVDDHLVPLLDYFERDLRMLPSDLSVMLRSFPGTMLLSMERNMRPAEQFLRDVGIKNVGRVFAMAPSILTFDVGTQLVPKMRFLDKVGLTAYDMANFPQLFNYPLDRIIRPRLLFLVYLRIPTTSKPLKNILATTDKEFCNHTVEVSPEKYAKFVSALPPMELPTVPRSVPAVLQGYVAYTRGENKWLPLKVKGDARLAGYKQMLSSIQKEISDQIATRQKGREFFDSQLGQWVYEGEGQFPPVSSLKTRTLQREQAKQVQESTKPDEPGKAIRAEGESDWM